MMNSESRCAFFRTDVIWCGSHAVIVVTAYRVIPSMSKKPKNSLWRQEANSVCDMKRRQSAKIREIETALVASGVVGLDAQAQALGISRSTAWTILKGNHKASGLSASLVNRILAA